MTHPLWRPWEFIADAFLDRRRRRNSISRILEGYLGGLAAMSLAFWLVFDWPGVWPLFTTKFWWIGVTAPLAAPLVEFVVFEYILEPLGFSGPYWERGPRKGERFRRP